ncbi:MAG: sulfotransferase [Actinobacteria bacterium]|nr:sulfotransferase [Actinomycetota bacterium]
MQRQYLIRPRSLSQLIPLIHPCKPPGFSLALTAGRYFPHRQWSTAQNTTDINSSSHERANCHSGERGKLTSAERLEELFAHRSGERYLLDATPEYIWLPGCLEALKRHCPDVKIIAVLREPAERARSQHALQMGREWETLSFPRALFAERKRLALDEAPMVLRSETRIHSYRTRGYYAHQIAHLVKIFPDALILAFDELLEKPDESLARAYEHLGLERPASSQELERLNAFRGEEFSLTEQILRLWMSRETRKTEKLLGWDRGALKRARSPRTH